MNAYELADELDACFTKADWEYVNDAVTMLRQQADRIAELEKQLKELSDEEIIESFLIRHGLFLVNEEVVDDLNVTVISKFDWRNKRMKYSASDK